MKRMKSHKIKKEKAEGSTQLRAPEEHDLAYYIHDRVELMHQVFSLLKYKELKAMAPECVRNLAIGDLEELCTEELLGISSKRLLAILDGVEPPSDTESSSPSPPPELETISLDSISSDEELLSTSSKKKKHKHRHHRSKSKSKKKDKSARSNKSDKGKQATAPADENSEMSKASRAGLTVLELLELQARARAIRAQLQQEQANKRPSETAAAESSHHSSDNEVEIKEERPEVVEISSEDEKPDVEKLKKTIADKSSSKILTNNKEPQKDPVVQPNSQTVTKRINDLIITVPQSSTRKIKLNRNKTIATTNNNVTTPTDESVVNNKPEENAPTISNSKPALNKPRESKPKKKKKDKKKKTVEKDGSDHDEITLQLSDSEKMDLFENLDESRKNYDKVSSSSEDSETSSSDSEEDSVDTSNNTSHNPVEPKSTEESEKTSHAIDLCPSKAPLDENAKESTENAISSPPKEVAQVIDSTEFLNENNDPESDELLKPTEDILNETNISNNGNSPTQNTEKDFTNGNKNLTSQNTSDQLPSYNNDKQNINPNEDKDTNPQIDVSNTSIESTPATCKSLQVTTSSNATRSVTVVDKPILVASQHHTSPPKDDGQSDNVLEINTIDDIPIMNEKTLNISDIESPSGSKKINESPKKSEHISDGELTDRQSSEVEAVDVQPEVVCISDEESPKKKSEKKKKKKEKKAKKEKKSKKSKSDFRESSDQNFYKDAHLLSDQDTQSHVKVPVNETSPKTLYEDEDQPIDLDSDDVYEILELSDDSSCYEVEGTVLSKEPTTEEIEALSARIDEIEREEVVTEEQIREHEQILAETMIQNEADEQNEEDVNNVSWKDRYLDSKKVKKVLTTANILNALRKKNKELKKKIQDSKKKEEEEEKQIVAEETAALAEEVQLEEGSIEQYNTLQGSTKYVDPVKEPVQKNQDLDQNKDDDKETSEILGTATSDKKTNVTREMKKDARQLLKMYKKLLKHNDMHKQSDPNKKKKKKLKKKDKDKNNSENNISTSNQIVST